jgi:hypothetical protein
MNISVLSNIVTIHGSIKAVSDYQDIKNTMEKVASEYKSIVLNIVDSISITSSVIGYLNKLVLKDNIDLKMNIGSEQLMELIEDLNLKSMFKAQKV